jgi:gamma-glutamylcyclotransferase (GGCT)/AIG2-like uncharacterized protein YtfP
MAKKCLLFAYGVLKPGFSPPKTVSESWEDRVQGDLVDLGSYPGACRIGDSNNWIQGITLEIDEDELAVLDEFEDVDSGEYRRILVETEQGFYAFIYEFLGALPPDAPRLTCWPAVT